LKRGRVRLHFRLRNAYRHLRTFFDEVEDSLKSHLNTKELSRITVTALGAGGGVFALLEAVMRSAGTIFPAPTDAALAATILATILESRRRLKHGSESTSGPRRVPPAR
jgi:hypothetical protein